MIEQNAYIEVDRSMPILILESCMPIVHNSMWGTCRRGEECALS